MIRVGNIVKFGKNKIGIVLEIDEDDVIVSYNGVELCCYYNELEVIDVQSK